MENKYDSPAYKQSRKAYVAQCTLEHLLGLLVADAYLAKLLSHLNMSDALVGIISSFVSVAFVFQLLAIRIVQSKISTKKAVILSDCASQLFFMLLYFIPFLPVPEGVKKALVIASVILGYAGKYIVLTLYFKWANAYVQPNRRGVFSANKESISLICGIVFTAIVGFFVDKFEGLGNLPGAFLFIASAMLIINVLNFVFLMQIKDEVRSAQKEQTISLKDTVRHIAQNKIYKSFLLSTFLAAVASGSLIGFLGIYKTKDLLLSVFTVQLINIGADGTRILISKPFGRFSDKFGFARGFELSMVLVLLSYITVALTAPDTVYLIILYTVLHAVAQAGSYQNSFNIGYTLLPDEYITQVSAIKSVVSGLTSFVCALIGGKILSTVQQNGNTVFGIRLYGQQLLAIIAIAVQILALTVMHCKVVIPIREQKLQSR